MHQGRVATLQVISQLAHYDAAFAKLPVCVLQSSRTLAWAEGNPHSEYQQEYYRKQLLRQQARRALLRDAGGAHRSNLSFLHAVEPDGQIGC